MKVGRIFLCSSVFRFQDSQEAIEAGLKRETTAEQRIAGGAPPLRRETVRGNGSAGRDMGQAKFQPCHPEKAKKRVILSESSE